MGVGERVPDCSLQWSPAGQWRTGAEDGVGFGHLVELGGGGAVAVAVRVEFQRQLAVAKVVGCAGQGQRKVLNMGGNAVGNMRFGVCRSWSGGDRIRGGVGGRWTAVGEGERREGEMDRDCESTNMETRRSLCRDTLSQ